MLRAFLLLVLGARVLFATPVVLTDAPGEFLIGPHCDILVDPRAELTFAEVTSPSFEPQFTGNRVTRPNFGYSTAAYWFRFTVTNESRNTEWFLNTTREWVEDVTLYSRDEAGGVVVQEAGTAHPFAGRLIVSERPVVRLTLPPHSERTYYLRLRTTASIALEGDLAPTSRFRKEEDFLHITYGGYFAVLLVMCAYNFFVFVTLRNAAYGFLALFLGSLFSMEFLAHGYAYRWIGKPINTVPFAVSLGCVAIGMTGLTRTFLTTKRHLPRADRALVILCSMSVTAAVLAWVFPWPTAVGFAWIVPLTLLVLGVSMVRWRQGFAPARYFTLAIAAYLLPAQLVLAQFFGLLPPNILTEYGTHMGAVLMAALYSFGLADHIRRLHLSSEKFVPTAFLRELGRESIADVQLGDAVDARVTVLFSDIRSFTSLSEGMTPRQNFEFVNAFLARLVPPITAAGGIIDKYIGDAVMAIFPGDPANAVQAARAMMTALDTFNAENRDVYPPIAIGIGLHHGTVRLGTVGNAGRMNATVIADAVNLASRLESLTVEKGVPILASEALFHELRSAQQSSLRYLGRASVKGKARDTGVYEVLIRS